MVSDAGHNEERDSKEQALAISYCCKNLQEIKNAELSPGHGGKSIYTTGKNDKLICSERERESERERDSIHKKAPLPGCHASITYPFT